MLTVKISDPDPARRVHQKLVRLEACALQIVILLPFDPRWGAAHATALGSSRLPKCLEVGIRFGAMKLPSC